MSNNTTNNSHNNIQNNPKKYIKYPTPIGRYQKFIKTNYPNLLKNKTGFDVKFQTGAKQMNEKLKKAINWINFAGAVLSIAVKVIQEIVDILPEREEKTNE